MSLTVKHLNGDTTFLLTFAPSERPLSTPPGRQSSHPTGTFTILVDPWLTGPCSMWHPKFLLSRHTVESCVPHLSHIPEPNVVLVSQDKPDHCHEATLRQLDPTSPITTILAEPAAVKKIRSMKHFHPSMVHSLRPFSSKNPDSVIRFFIPPIVPGGSPGEATISFIPAKMDAAGVHNAIGVTYRPPSSISMQARPFSPSSGYDQSNFTYGTDAPTANLPMTPPESPLPRDAAFPPTSASQRSTTPTSASRPSDGFSSRHNLSLSSISSTSTQQRIPRQPREKTLSFIYSPHGVDYPLLRSYASSHLISAAALPLTLLLHSFDRVNNPWWMGGNVNAGLPGGVEIAQNLMARFWISAHDEDKDNTGISVKNVKTRKYTLEEVDELCRQGAGAGNTNVLSLAPGDEIVLRS